MAARAMRVICAFKLSSIEPNLALLITSFQDSRSLIAHLSVAYTLQCSPNAIFFRFHRCRIGWFGGGGRRFSERIFRRAASRPLTFTIWKPTIYLRAGDERVIDAARDARARRVRPFWQLHNLLHRQDVRRIG